MISVIDSWLWSTTEAIGGDWGDSVGFWGGIILLVAVVARFEGPRGESWDVRKDAFASLRLLLFFRTWLTFRVANFFFSRTHELQTRDQNSSNFFLVVCGYSCCTDSHFLSMISDILPSGRITFLKKS